MRGAQGNADYWPVGSSVGTAAPHHFLGTVVTVVMMSPVSVSRTETVPDSSNANAL